MHINEQEAQGVNKDKMMGVETFKTEGRLFGRVEERGFFLDKMKG